MDKNTKEEYEKARDLRNLATYFRKSLDTTTEQGKETEKHFNAVISYAAELMEFFAKH